MKKLNRRKFLENSALLGGAMFLPACATAPKKLGANEKMNVALIGTGGIGRLSVNKLRDAKRARFAAFCDIDDERPAQTYKEFPSVARFRDFRRMLDKMDKEIDGVVISTPDHMHYPIASWALKMGKHVYCQKPLTRTVWEARELNRIANETGLITQMGNQGHTFEGWRVIKEWYDAGIIGKIENIYSWTDRPINFWKQGLLARPKAEPIPATIDHKLWLGVAPDAPYTKDILPFNWRGYRDYGTGAGGDMACHVLDVSYSAFELGLPNKVYGDSTEYTEWSWPQECTAHLEFDNPRGVDGKIRLHWFDGGRKPKDVKRVEQSFIDDPRLKNGTLIVGTKETVFTDTYGMKPMIFPRKRMVDLKRSGALPKPTLPRSKFDGNPQEEWVEACYTNTPPPANFNYASTFTEMSLLMLVPILERGVLEYDAKNMRFLNNAAANKHLYSLYDYKREFIA